MHSVVTLLRGINVGGKRRVPMAGLRTMFTSTLGCEDVRTYVQSGNVVFTPPHDDVDALELGIERAIEATFGLDVKIAVRTRDELAAVVADNPMNAETSEPTKVHVIFLRDAPTPEAIADLDVDRSPPDRFEVRGREIFVHYPNGAARTKLTGDYFERTLGTPATARNWNTVNKLLAMASAE